MIRYAQGLQVVPLRAPAVTTDDAESAWVKLENLHWMTFLIQWGEMAGSTDSFNIAVKSTTSATSGTTNASDYALPFSYRLSSAVGTDDWGDITAVSTDVGYATVTAVSDNMMMIVDVDPAVIPAHDSDAAYVYVDIDCLAEESTDANYALDIIGVFEPRYPQNEQLSSL